MLDAQVAAWNRGDIDGFMSGYRRSDDTTFVSGDTVTRGWQTVRDRYAKKYDSRAKMGTLTFSGLTITPLSPDVRDGPRQLESRARGRSSALASSPCSSASCRKAGASCSITLREADPLGQRGQQLLVDAVETAVAEDRHHVVRL